MKETMDKLLYIREYAKVLISRYDSYVRPFSKFLLMFITLTVINSKVGYASRIDSVALTLVVSLLVSFLPLNFIPIISAGYIMLHMYGLSLESAAVIGIMLFVMFLLYFRFAPNDSILLVLTPLAFVLRIPYAMPLVAGLVAAPTAMASVGCGVITYFMLYFVARNEAVIRAMADEDMLTKFKFLLEELLFNREMMVMAAAFAITIVVVYVVRRLPVDHCWTMAIVTGVLMNMIIIMVGDLKYGTYVSLGGLVFGSIVGVIVAYVVKFFLFNLDYSRTENVQFEDDQYYYYVKAVPKNSISEEALKRLMDDEDDEEEERPVRRREERTAKSRTSEKSLNSKISNSKVSNNKSSSRSEEKNRTRTSAPSGRNSAGKTAQNRSSGKSSSKSATRSGSKQSSVREDGITDIERAALAKARASRNKNRE